MPHQIEFFDSQAETWEAKSYPPEVRLRLEELVLDLNIRPGNRVLDVGAGSGVLHPYLLPIIGNRGKLVSLDLSYQMVRQCKKKDCADAVFSFQGDAQKLPLTSGLFDAVICFACFPHLHDKEAALAESSRVLTTNGTIYIAHLLSSKELSQHHRSHQAVKHDLLPGPEAMKELCRKSGLSDPEIIDRPGRYLLRATKL